MTQQTPNRELSGNIGQLRKPPVTPEVNTCDCGGWANDDKHAESCPWIVTPDTSDELREQIGSLFDSYAQWKKDFDATGVVGKGLNRSMSIQHIVSLIHQQRAEAVEQARSKDPHKCGFGHEVYSHKTADGFCCACEADQAFWESDVEKEVQRRLAQLQTNNKREK